MVIFKFKIYKIRKLNFEFYFCRLDVLKYSIILAVNENYIDMSEQVHLNENDNIAIIPPLSGG